MHRVQSHAHHYVPEWYQRRFLPPGVTKYYYLDLQPETIVQDGYAHQRKAIRHLGPDSCFYKDDLYALNFAGRAEGAKPPITAERDEVQITEAVVAAQSRHSQSRVSHPSPFCDG